MVDSRQLLVGLLEEPQLHRFVKDGGRPFLLTVMIRVSPSTTWMRFENNLIGIPGDDDQAQATETLNAPAWLENGASYLHIFSKSELYFILAEAKARLNADAKADFESAVSASLDDYVATGGGVVGVSISDSVRTDYISRMVERFTANPLSEILIQKYIAQTRDEQLETYNDMRRCIYVDGSYPVKMTNPKNVQSGASRWPLRLPMVEVTWCLTPTWQQHLVVETMPVCTFSPIRCGGQAASAKCPKAQ
jgi:hypothetical protein